MGLVERLIYVEKKPVIGGLAHQLLLAMGVDIPPEVPIGSGLVVHHRGRGIVMHPKTRIGNRVVVFHQVTIGRADVYVPEDRSSMSAIHVEDDAMLCAGAKILGGPGVTRIGRGTVIGANAVLTRSTGDWEVWAGMPARKIGERDPETGQVTATGLSEPRSAVPDGAPLYGSAAASSA